MTITIPTTTDIGAALERAARITAVLIAATLAAGFITRQTLSGLATFAINITRRPLRTLIELVPVVTPTPAPTPSLLTMLGAELLTDEQMLAEIARYDASARRKRPAATRPIARRKPAGGRKAVEAG